MGGGRGRETNRRGEKREREREAEDRNLVCMAIKRFLGLTEQLIGKFLYTNIYCFLTCPVRPALVVVKLMRVIIDAASGGISGAGFRVARNRRKSS